MKKNVPQREPHLFTNLVDGRCGSGMSIARGRVEADKAKEGEAVSHPGLLTIADEGLSGRTGQEAWRFIFIGTLERRGLTQTGSGCCEHSTTAAVVTRKDALRPDIRELFPFHGWTRNQRTG